MRLNHRVKFCRKLLYFPDQPLQRARDGWTKKLDEPARSARRTTAQDRKTGADDAKACEQRAYGGQVPGTPEHPGTLTREGQAFRRRVHQHDTHHFFRVPRRIGANDKAAE
jgi:hypothetical protein